MGGRMLPAQQRASSHQSDGAGAGLTPQGAYVPVCLCGQPGGAGLKAMYRPGMLACMWQLMSRASSVNEDSSRRVHHGSLMGVRGLKPEPVSALGVRFLPCGATRNS